MKTTITITALLVAALALAAARDKVEFKWNPVKGEKAEYTTTNSHETDMGGGAVDLVVIWDSTITVDKVDGKRVTLDSVSGEPIAQIDGVDEPGIHVRISDSLDQYGLNCEFFPEDDTERGFSFGLYSGFVLPKSPVEAGEKYEVGAMNATYVGTEKVKKWDAHRFTFEFRPKDRDSWTEGTIWLSTDDLTIVKRTATLHGVDFGMGPEDVKNEIVRTK